MEGGEGIWRFIPSAAVRRLEHEYMMVAPCSLQAAEVTVGLDRLGGARSPEKYRNASGIYPPKEPQSSLENREG